MISTRGRRTGWTAPALVQDRDDESGGPDGLALDHIGSGLLLFTEDVTFRARRLPPTGPWPAAVTLSLQGNAGQARLAANRRGAAVAAWTQGSSGPRSAPAVWAALFDPAAGWSPPELLDVSTGDLFNYLVRVTMDGVGNGVVAWADEDGWASRRFGVGAGWGPRLALPGPQLSTDVQLTATPSGDVFAFWSLGESLSASRLVADGR